MTPEDQATIDAIKRLYAGALAHRISDNALVRHSPLTGRAYVHLDPIMASGLRAQGYDPSVSAQNYEESLKRSGLWPADLPPVLRRRARRWSRRRWRVVVGR